MHDVYDRMTVSEISSIRYRFYHDCIDRNRKTRKDKELLSLYKKLQNLEREKIAEEHIKSPKFYIKRKGEYKKVAAIKINDRFAHVILLEMPSSGNFNKMRKTEFGVTINELITEEEMKCLKD